jgi:hypothetical protein
VGDGTLLLSTRQEYRDTVGTVARQIAEAFTKAWNSAVAAETRARNMGTVLHGHPLLRDPIAFKTQPVIALH